MTNRSDYSLELSKEMQHAGPKYARLKRFLTGELAAGRMREGEALPSVRQMADSHGIARDTVRQALGEMEQEGLVRREQGRGTFVTEDARDRLRKDKKKKKISSLVLLAQDTGTMDVAMLDGFERACKAIHCHMIVCNAENDLNLQGNLILKLLHEDVGIDGVVMYPVETVPTPAFQVASIQARGIPVVICHRPVEGIRAPLVAVPHAQMGRLVAEALLERGHRRVAKFATAGEAFEPSRRGLAEALRAGGGELPEEFVHMSQAVTFNPADIEKEATGALRQMLGYEARPTAIWCTFGKLAEAIYLELQRLGLRVPEDISLIGWGDVRRDGPLARRITSVVIDDAEIARQAVDLLREMCSGKRQLENNEQFTATFDWHEGETLGPAPETSPRQEQN